jgi:hypothetical protein
VIEDDLDSQDRFRERAFHGLASTIHATSAPIPYPSRAATALVSPWKMAGRGSRDGVSESHMKASATMPGKKGRICGLSTGNFAMG